MSVSDTKNNTSKFEVALLNPRITEKASDKAEHNVYVFDVNQRANKVQIKEAVKKIYNVDATKINVTKTPSKKVFSRGRRGIKSAGRKAYVYLKKGDKIEII